MPDARLTMRRCTVQNAIVGICAYTNVKRMFGPSTGAPDGTTVLEAYDTQATDCTCGVRVERCSEAQLVNCEFSRNATGIMVSGNNQTCVRLWDVKCVGNSGPAVHLDSGVDMVMNGCELIGNGRPVLAEDPGVLLVLSKCVFDGQVLKMNGARVEVRGRVEAGDVINPTPLDDLD